MHESEGGAVVNSGEVRRFRLSLFAEHFGDGEGR
tara:strand:+ start:163 stop:264 length:102 start_codon:yes stop_codon:yes gene_type:complete